MLNPTKMTKAEAERLAAAKAIESATKKIETISFEDARNQYLAGEIKVEGLRNVFCAHMNERFAYTMDDGGFHWSVIWNSKNAKHDSSNLQPIWKAIDAERQELETMLKAKKHSNPAKVWQRVRERGYEMAHPGQKRPPRQSELPAVRFDKLLIAAYTVVAKEDIQSPEDQARVRGAGELLIALGIDLAKINQKINK